MCHALQWHGNKTFILIQIDITKRKTKTRRDNGSQDIICLCSEGHTLGFLIVNEVSYILVTHYLAWTE